MITATADELLEYLADVVERAERFGPAVSPTDGGDEIAWERDGPELVMSLAVHPPLDPRSHPARLLLHERWREAGRDRWEYVEYGYEMRHYELDYRRALHRHHVDHSVRTYGVATHERCEVPMGHASYDHYAGVPVLGSLDGFDRLYGLWLTGAPPDCSALRCLG